MMVVIRLRTLRCCVSGCYNVAAYKAVVEIGGVAHVMLLCPEHTKKLVELFPKTREQLQAFLRGEEEG